MRTVAAHQPNYFPWPGYFYKMIKCDDFVISDDDIMSKPSFTHRNRIKTERGVIWLTVPCSRVVGETPIKDVILANNNWRRKHLGIMKHSYLRAPFFQDYMPRLQEIVMSDVDGLCSLNVRLILQIAEWLDIRCTFHISSKLDVSGTKDEKIVNLMKRLGGDTYLSGTGASTYQSEATFKKASIDLVYYDFKPPVYPQLWGEFVPGLSILDLLFNCGPDSRAILDRCGSSDEENRTSGIPESTVDTSERKETDEEIASFV